MQGFRLFRACLRGLSHSSVCALAGAAASSACHCSGVKLRTPARRRRRSGRRFRSTRLPPRFELCAGFVGLELWLCSKRPYSAHDARQSGAIQRRRGTRKTADGGS